MTKGFLLAPIFFLLTSCALEKEEPMDTHRPVPTPPTSGSTPPSAAAPLTPSPQPSPNPPPSPTAPQTPILIIGDSSLMHAKDPLYKLLLNRFKKEDIFLYSVCGSGGQHWLGEGEFKEKICGHRLIEPPTKSLKKIHRLKKLMEHVAPKTIVMSLGTNNFATPKTTFQKDYKSLYDIANKNGGRCLHFGPWNIERPDVKKALPAVYESLKEIIGNTGCQLFDMRPIAHASKQKNESYDDLHLKPGGAEEMKFVKFIAQEIEKKLP